MLRIAVFVAVLVLGTAPLAAQEGRKAVPSSAISQSPFAKLPPRPSGDRTIEVLRAAGILNVRTDSPFTLSARQPYLDPQTYLTAEWANFHPERNVIIMRRPESGISFSIVTIHWFGNPDRRYVVDCAFTAGSGAVHFDWAEGLIPSSGFRQNQDVPIVNGRAAVILPPGAGSTVHINSQEAAELSSCDVTPFGE